MMLRYKTYKAAYAYMQFMLNDVFQYCSINTVLLDYPVVSSH